MIEDLLGESLSERLETEKAGSHFIRVTLRGGHPVLFQTQSSKITLRLTSFSPEFLQEFTQKLMDKFNHIEGSTLTIMEDQKSLCVTRLLTDRGSVLQIN